MSIDTEFPAVPWSDPEVPSLRQAILYAVTYADIYRYPLTVEEIARYLVGVQATVSEVRAALEQLTRDGEPLQRQDAYVMLQGAEDLVALRHRREAVARRMWPLALSYGQAIAHLPFVRMVAVTGALTMGNVEFGDDIDFFVVTEPGRVWLTRFLIVQRVVKPADRQGVEVCPNYLISSEVLTLEKRDLFHAHELVQMVPLSGLPIYQELRAANRWALGFLPNATDTPTMEHLLEAHAIEERELEQRPIATRPLEERSLDNGPFTLRAPSSRLQSISEQLLRTPPGTWFDRREMERMRAKLTDQNGGSEVEVTPDRCKGHIGSHGHKALEAFAARVDRWRTLDG